MTHWGQKRRFEGNYQFNPLLSKDNKFTIINIMRAFFECELFLLTKNAGRGFWCHYLIGDSDPDPFRSCAPLPGARLTGASNTG